MGFTVRDRHIRTKRRIRSVKPESDHSTGINGNSNVEKSADSNLVTEPKNSRISLSSLNLNPSPMPTPNPNSNPGSNSVLDDSGWGYCTEEQLEEMLLKHLEFLYDEAINRLVGSGHDEEMALRAVLTNGYFYGGKDVLNNILDNALAYLKSGCSDVLNGEQPEQRSAFTDLRQLQEYSLAGMVCLLQQAKPQLTKGDAMWCLLMSDLDVCRASMMEIPVLSSPSGTGSSNGKGCMTASASVGGSLEGCVSSVEPVGGPVVFPPTLCRFNGGWGFGNGGMSDFPINGMNRFLPDASEMALQREIVCPQRFNLSPSMKNMLKRNVAMFAAGFRANSKQFHSSLQACSSLSSGSDTSSGCDPAAEVSARQSEESLYAKNQDVVNSVMTKFRDLNLDESAEKVYLDQKDETFISLVRQIKDLEKQVNERKEWAHQKAMQAARKLSHDLTELKMLRMEREEMQRLKKTKQTLEESTLKRLKEMENALKTASGQVDRANAAVRKLENENAEIRAEMEASKLSASESVTACLEVAKREKRCLKRLLAWEKQKTKMQEDVAAEKQKISELQQELAQVLAATKKAEEKWRQEQKAKGLVLEKLEEEQRLKEAAEVNSKRKLEALRQKIEIDSQRLKDDIQRLEHEYARLKDNAHPTEVDRQSNYVWADISNGLNPQGETIAKLLHELDGLEDSPDKVRCDRKCMICKKDEVSIVFLPCAHQVICASCNENYGRKGKATCVCCKVTIEQRIRVYGASS